jgi:hypothetical protein
VPFEGNLTLGAYQAGRDNRLGSGRRLARLRTLGRPPGMARPTGGDGWSLLESADTGAFVKVGTEALRIVGTAGCALLQGWAGLVPPVTLGMSSVALELVGFPVPERVSDNLFNGLNELT